MANRSRLSVPCRLNRTVWPAENALQARRVATVSKAVRIGKLLQIG
jgi:hypothetical protein